MECLKLNDIIKNTKNILIISHINPDGDTLGSMSALSNMIYKNFKKRPETMIISKIPKHYEFLSGISDAKPISEYDKSRVYDLVILVDVAALDRIGVAQIFYEKAKVKITIDHHKTNNYDADYRFIESSASSTGEVIYNLAKKCNWKTDLDIANALYTAILTDTGGFRFNNTSSEVLKIASELVESGVKPFDVYKKCYETKTKEMVMFQANCLCNANFVYDDKIVYSIIYKKDFEKYKSSEDFTDGLVEALRSINSTQVAFIVKEIDNKVFKVSLRSKKVDVAKVSAVFSGGGHTLAAGCTIKNSAKDVVKKIIDEIVKQEL